MSDQNIVPVPETSVIVLLTEIKTKLETALRLQDDHDKRIRALENWRSAIVGALFLLSSLVGWGLLNLSKITGG